MQVVPAALGICLELAYPPQRVRERLALRHQLDLNDVVNSVLRTVYDTSALEGHIGRRPVVFTSFAPDVCAALNWKRERPAEKPLQQLPAEKLSQTRSCASGHTRGHITMPTAMVQHYQKPLLEMGPLQLGPTRHQKQIPPTEATLPLAPRRKPPRVASQQSVIAIWTMRILRL